MPDDTPTQEPASRSSRPASRKTAITDERLRTRSSRAPKRNAARPRRPATKRTVLTYLPYAVLGLVLVAIDAFTQEVPFRSLSIAGIVLVIYAFIQIGSLNEIDTDTSEQDAPVRKRSPA